MNAVDFNLENLQNAILANVASTFIPTVDLEKLIEKIILLDDWHTKMQVVIELLIESKCYVNEKYLVEIVNGFYNRYLSSFFETVTEMIQSDITLVRAKESAIEDIDEMYELPSCTKGSVSLKYVDGNHSSVLRNSSLANVINQLCGNSA